MGVLAAALLIDHVEGRRIERRQVTLETQLVVRGSTAAPAVTTARAMKSA
jgi:DNA-binding LacI/PurR family transcriptional regulator